MIKDKVFQLFIVGTGKNFDYFLENSVGGVIFFTHDITSAFQFRTSIDSIKAQCNKIAPFLSIDQEGGRVERTENIHERYLSPQFAFQKGVDFLRKQTENIANELNDYGINMNFAPCIDVNSNPNNPIIGERAFSNNPDDVCIGYNIVSTEYKNHGIIPVIKHFPGHGDADKDSHKELPVISLSMKDMEKTHIFPFQYAIRQGADIVMVAHLHCKCFDNDEIPTSLSENCIKYLRNNLQFSGVTISDDMFMNGVAKYGMTEACLMGIKAGLNMFIYRESSDETLNVIENVIKAAEKDVELREKINVSYNKIIDLKRKYNLIK